MASRATETFTAASSALPAVSRVGTADEKADRHDLLAPTVKPHDGSETPSDDIENPQNGVFHQYIEKNGREFLVTWTKEEEKRIVRKADFLFLPIFAVSNHGCPYADLMRSY